MSSKRSVSMKVVVIGAGTAGLAAYRAVAARAPDVVLVEGGPAGTKLLIAAGDAAHRARQAGPFGVSAKVDVDGGAVMARVRRSPSLRPRPRRS